MMTDQKIAFYTSELRNGGLSPAQQIAMADDLVEFVIEFRKMRTTLDAQYQEAREQDEIDRRVKAESALAEHIKLSGNIAMFPTLLRRPLPVRIATPPVVAVEGEIWR